MREAVKGGKRRRSPGLFQNGKTREIWCGIFARCKGAAAFLYDTETDTLLFEGGSEKKRIRHFLKEGYRRFPAIPEDSVLFRRAVADAKDGKTRRRQCRIRIPDRKGDLRWYDCRIAALSRKKGIVVGGIFTDMTRQYRIVGQLRKQVRMDVLTGLYNKAGEALIADLLSERASGTFLMVDLDNFREINSIYGHPQGDRILWETGRALQEVSGENAVAIRAGGDEFVVFWPDGGKEEAAERARAILEKLAGIRALGEETVLTGSIGIALAPEDGKTYGELYAAADQAMYQVKNDSKQGYAYFRDGSES